MAFPRIVRNFYLQFNGLSQVGRCEEIELPTIKTKTEKYRAGGNETEVEVDLGFEIGRAKFTMLELDPFILSRLGAYFRDTIVTAKAVTRQQNNPAPGLLTFRMQGSLVDFDPGKLKAGEMSRFTFEVALNLYEIDVDNVPMVAVDSDAGIRMISGIDQSIINRARAAV